MATNIGRDAVLQIADTDVDGDYVSIAKITSISHNQSNDVADETNNDSAGFKESKYSDSQHTINAGFKWSFADPGQDEAATAANAKTDKFFRFRPKVASGEVGNLPMLRCMIQTGLPIILSSGMSPLSELDSAVNIIRDHGSPFAVLQCTTAYPCPPQKVGLNLMPFFQERYQCPVGLSDHSGTISDSSGVVTRF